MSCHGGGNQTAMEIGFTPEVLWSPANGCVMATVSVELVFCRPSGSPNAVMRVPSVAQQNESRYTSRCFPQGSPMTTTNDGK